MKRLITILALLLAVWSCKKDDAGNGNRTGMLEVNVTAPTEIGFSWKADQMIGLYSDNLTMANSPFSSKSANGISAVFEGAAKSYATTYYAYYPYNLAVGKYPGKIFFNLQGQQQSDTNVDANSFFIATPFTAKSANSGISLDFQPVSAYINFKITLPAGAEPRVINSIVVTCESQPFRTHILANLTTNEISFPERGPISSKNSLTLNIKDAPTSQAGDVVQSTLVVAPDDYSIKDINIELITSDGNYKFDYSIGQVLDRGDVHTLNYTLDNDDWYDPTLLKIEALAMEATSPLSTPVKVNLNGIISKNIEPAKITLIPTAGGDDLIYEIIQKERGREEVIIKFTTGGAARPAANTEYLVSVFDEDNVLLAKTTIRTSPAMSTADIDMIEPGVDIKSVLENSGRKTKVFLKPGNYTNSSSAVAIAKDLILMADDPSNTVITSTVQLFPRGVIATLKFSGFTWKGNGGCFIRCDYNTNAGLTSFDFADISIDNVVFDFSGISTAGMTSTIFYARCRGSENGNNMATARVSVGNLTLNDVIYMSGVTDNMAVLWHSGGSGAGADVGGQIKQIKVTNSTFTRIQAGMVLFPTPTSATVPYQSQLLYNGCTPKIIFENNTLYDINFGAGTAYMINAGTDNTYSLPVELSLKNNIIVFNSTNPRVLSCPTASLDGNKYNYVNNWGLAGQSWWFNGGANQFTGLGDAMLSGTKAEAFVNPMNNATHADASFRVTSTNVNAKKAGDPRWR